MTGIIDQLKHEPVDYNNAAWMTEPLPGGLTAAVFPANTSARDIQAAIDQGVKNILLTEPDDNTLALIHWIFTSSDQDGTPKTSARAWVKIDDATKNGPLYAVEQIAGRYDLNTTDGQAAALDNICQYISPLKDAIQRPEVVEYTADRLDLLIDEVAADIDKQAQTEADRVTIRQVTKLTARVQKQLDAGDIPKAIADLADGAQGLKLEHADRVRRDTLPTADRIRQIQASALQPGQIIGYKLNRFSEIQEALNGIRPGMYLLAAYWNMGKTAMLLNLFYDALESNKELTGLYISLDDQFSDCIHRLISIKTCIDKLPGVKINDTQYRHNDDKQNTIDRAYETLETLADSGRLTIYDQESINTLDEIEALILKHTAGDKKIIVAIDGLYNATVPGQQGSIREENIERANSIKRMADVYGIPILCTAEVRKSETGKTGKERTKPTLSDIMESGKYLFNAKVIWLLYPYQYLNKSTDQPDEYEYSDSPAMILEYAKNKLNSERGKYTYTFDRSYSYMEPLPK